MYKSGTHSGDYTYAYNIPCNNLHTGKVLLYLPLCLILMHKKQILLSGGIH